MLSVVRGLLAHPDTKGLSVDNSLTTALRKGIIRKNRFLWRIYDEWYRMLAQQIPDRSEPVLELGSGAGFLAEYIPRLITTEVFPCAGIDAVTDACHMPLKPGSLRGIVMVDVLHHIPDVRRFFREADRCLTSGGLVAMVEPWRTGWSQWIYRNLHHEPFEPDTREWAFPSSGPLSGANGALPWIVFERDRNLFEREFPRLRIERIWPFMPIRYMVSGGVSMRPLMPEFMFPVWSGLEHCLAPWRNLLAMFALIILRKEDAPFTATSNSDRRASSPA
jgi:SAM-dependent methyltransferase